MDIFEERSELVAPDWQQMIAPLPETQSRIRGDTHAMGWLPDLPDPRDYSPTTDKLLPTGKRDKVHSIKSFTESLGLTTLDQLSLSRKIDWRGLCSPIENQGNLGSCTAQAGVGLYEYMDRRALGKYIDYSKLFLYKVTRNLLGFQGDTGAYLRSTMGALRLFGVCPENHWPYTTARASRNNTDRHFDIEPSAFCYNFAQNFQALNYFRYDPPGTSSKLVLQRVKGYLAAGIPCMFGFTVFESINQASSSGKIPIPVRGERLRGGHAVMAVGYDDEMEIDNDFAGSKKTKGALIIRNSWGNSWGDKGYGYLPYDYVLEDYSRDFWSLLSKEWVDTGNFGI